MRLLRVLTLLLAIAGIAGLILAARATARPLTAVSAVNPAMNFAYVRIEGQVLTYPSVSTQDGYLSFNVQDASGEIRVSAYRSTMESLLAQKHVPMPGDRVTAEGTLRVRDDGPSMTLNAADALGINPPAAKSVQLSALDAMQLGQCASTSGQVRRVRDASATLRIVTLRQGSAEADMLLPLGLGEVFGVAPSLSVGEWISVSGSVGEFRGKRQLLPLRAEAIAEAHRPPPDVRPMTALSKALVGQWITVRGQVDKLKPIQGGMLLNLKDRGGGAVTVTLFETWVEVPFSQTLTAGDMVVASGELVNYHGQLEVQPELSVDLVRGE